MASAASQSANGMSHGTLQINAVPSLLQATVANGCSVTTDCKIGYCKNGNCIPCTGDNECIAGICSNGSCSGPTLVAAASICGNGILDSFEECDDANQRSGDGCSDACKLEIGVCGDGIIQTQLGEQCEMSLMNPHLPYTCSNCRFVSRACGDGKIDPGEECDKGPLNSTSHDAACRPDCSLARCGDGIRDSGEDCDDGNRMSGDGCDASCRIEKKPTAILADSTVQQGKEQPAVRETDTQAAYNQLSVPFPFQAQPQSFTFPQQLQPYPYQPSYAQLQPLLAQAPHTAQSGPAAVAAIGAGAASGIAWVRRRRRK